MQSGPARNPTTARPGRVCTRDHPLPPDTRRVLHLDVDAFLASVEQVAHPELQGKALVIGGLPHTRNLVMSCSYEARAYGVRPGMRSSEAARRCPHAVFRQGDSQAANRLRDEITRSLLELTPLVEVASIDDFFVDLTGTGPLLGATCAVAERARRKIQEEIGLPVTIGIATNRTLARLAGKLAKPGGIAEILPGMERTFLTRLPVEHLPGVGHMLARKLEEFSIRTVGQLTLLSREVLFAAFGVHGLVAYTRARGIDEDPVLATHRLAADGTLTSARPPRSIRRDSTFEPEEPRRKVVEAMLGYLVDRGAWQLRRYRLACGSLEVRLEYVDTRPPQVKRRDPHGIERWLSARTSLTRGPSAHGATNATDELVELARKLLRKLPRKRALVRRVGISMYGLRTSDGRQGLLFSDPEMDRPPEAEQEDTPEARGAPGSLADRKGRLDAALDLLREKHGFGRVLRGSCFELSQDSIGAAGSYPLGPDGLQLRTPSLNQ